MTGYLQVLTTVDSKKKAHEIAAKMVKARLAACCQIIPRVTSVYRWKGKVETAKEWLCLLKTKKSLYMKFEKKLRSLHPYEVPEIVALPIECGIKPYLTWIKKSTIS